jgi:hypothetical protein
MIHSDPKHISTAELEIGYLGAQLGRMFEEYNEEIAAKLFSRSNRALDALRRMLSDADCEHSARGVFFGYVHEVEDDLAKIYEARRSALGRGGTWEQLGAVIGWRLQCKAMLFRLRCAGLLYFARWPHSATTVKRILDRMPTLFCSRGG